MIRRTVRITFPSNVIDRPIIHSLIKQFDLLVNIREAHLDPSRGWLIVEVGGEPHVIERALAWASEQGVVVQPEPADRDPG